MNISKILTDWYENHKRELPWRETIDPYKIWISEIILQQTRVMQGLHYYHKFLEKFPDIETLAFADEDNVLKVWQGLGYYSRARNMHTTAKIITEKYKGNFPVSYEEIIKLKGIGPYTAAAISSLAFNQAVPAVDGNVIRVLSRLFAVKGNKNSTSFIKEIHQLALSILNKNNPGQHNQALIELGALVCKPLKPECAYCPVQSCCHALANNMVNELPERYGKKVPKDRYFHYYFFQHNNRTYITKRTQKDIWNSLYELPLFESTDPVEEDVLISIPQKYWGLREKNMCIKKITRTQKHLLSHQNIYIRFIFADLDNQPERKDWLEIDPGEAAYYAFPVPLANFIASVIK